MNIDSIRQAMMKKAASNSAKQDHSKLHKNPSDIPGGPTAYIRASGGADDKYKNEAWNNFQEQRSNWRGIGANPYDYRYNTKGKNPIVEWRLKTSKPDGGTAVHTSMVWPNQLINARVGAWLMSPSYQHQQQTDQKASPIRIALGRPGAALTDEIIRTANTGRTKFTLQPFNNEKLMRIMTLDPQNRNYLNELLNHYRHIPIEAWHNANLQPSSAEEIEAWKKDVPPLNTAADNGGMYWSDTGKIDITPNSVIDRYDDTWGYKANTGWWTDSIAPEESRGNRMTTSPTLAGIIGDMYGHEAGHRNLMGLTKATRTKGPPDWESSSRPFNPKMPISAVNVPALMRPVDWRTLPFDQQQYAWLKNRATQSYAVNETEMNQALTSFNRGRWALKRDMENNPDNPNYKYLEANYPGLIDKFKALPDFIPAGKAGREQLDNMMQFFIQNPQLKVLMPEQARLVGYYQNLKAGVDNADTPEEKQFFQNLMNRLIYSKAFLANNQQTRPTYQDAYQQMYA